MQLIKMLAGALVVLVIVALMQTCGQSTEYRHRRRWSSFFRRRR